jgi:hypothetical protein
MLLVLSSIGASVIIGLLYQFRMNDGDDDDDCGVVSEMKGRGNRSTRRKPVLVSFYQPEIPHDMNCDRTRAIELGRQRLAA